MNRVRQTAAFEPSVTDAVQQVGVRSRGQVAPCPTRRTFLGPPHLTPAGAEAEIAHGRHSGTDPIEHSIVIDSNIVARRTGASVVLVNLSMNRIYELNETGARIWELLQQGRRSTEIIDQLCGEFAVAPRQATEAYKKLVSELLDRGLISWEPAISGGRVRAVSRWGEMGEPSGEREKLRHDGDS